MTSWEEIQADLQPLFEKHGIEGVILLRNKIIATVDLSGNCDAALIAAKDTLQEELCISNTDYEYLPPLGKN